MKEKCRMFAAFLCFISLYMLRTWTEGTCQFAFFLSLLSHASGSGYGPVAPAEISQQLFSCSEIHGPQRMNPTKSCGISLWLILSQHLLGRLAQSLVDIHGSVSLCPILSDQMSAFPSVSAVICVECWSANLNMQNCCMLALSLCWSAASQSC